MSSIPAMPSLEGDYAWEIATLYPEQGGWTEEKYLDLTDYANRRIEYNDGRLEFLPMPTMYHEKLVRFLFLALYHFVDQRKLGETFSNGIRLRIPNRKYRMPDVIFLHRDHFHACHNRVWDGADLVMEVVSEAPTDRMRDYEEKLAEYAAAGVAEYWIIDGERQAVVVNGLVAGAYSVLGEYTRGQTAASKLLEQFGIDVTSLFAAAENIPE